MKKKSLFRGLAAVCGLLCAVSGFITPVAYANAGNINTFLGISAPSINASATPETMYFKTAYTSDGLVSEEGQAGLIEAEDAYNIRSMEEGAVLVYNRDNALPLKAERNVTLFGSVVAKPITHGASDPDRWIDFDAALSAAGFNINKTVLDAYKSSATARDLKTSDIGEEPISFYTQELRNSFSQYHDAAIVMLSRIAAEGTDMAISDADGIPQLSLHQDEKDMLKMIQESGFDKTIVIVNSGYAMDLGWLEEYGVDACFVISAPGLNGYVGVANLLTGDANFSGKLTDTYATDSLSSPAAMNLGDFTWANADEIKGFGKGTNTDKYLIQAEGIYTGYKYYETRYEDCILGQGNAACGKGVYASASGTWNYADEVVFPFGYGLSYTTFEQRLDQVTMDETAHTVTAVVTVTNTGDVAGKSVVELYAQTPYTQYDRDNGVEKSAIQLLDFGKTDTIEPGDSATVTLTSDLYLLASYDENGAKGYIMDAGDYYLAIGGDAHDALNNILAAKGGAELTDAEGNPVAGDVENTYHWVQNELDTQTYRLSAATGAEVTNRFDGQIDLNDLMPDTVTYLSRSDWEGTYPVSYTNLSADSAMFPALDGNTYQQPTDAPKVSDFAKGRSAGLSLVDMKDVPYDDNETWDKFLDQMTVQDLTVALCDNFGIEAVPSVGKPYHQDKDGPEGVQATYPYGNIPCTIYVDPCVSAASWSKELLTLRGSFMGEDAIYSGVPFLWSIGANLHRTPYNGRNYQYFSECSIFTYYAGACVTQGMTEKGVAAGIKHFAANDQELNRMGVATFMTEQTLRQNAFRGFEGAITQAHSLGIMSSYNRFGCVAASQDPAAQTGVLREEWGFEGINVTDAALNERYMHSLESVAAGSDMFCMQPARSKDFLDAINGGDGYMLQAVRTANKHYYYAMSRSLLTNGLEPGASVQSFVPWWQPALIAVDVVTALGCIGFAALYLMNGHKRKEKTA